MWSSSYWTSSYWTGSYWTHGGIHHTGLGLITTSRRGTGDGTTEGVMGRRGDGAMGDSTAGAIGLDSVSRRIGMDVVGEEAGSG